MEIKMKLVYSIAASAIFSLVGCDDTIQETSPQTMSFMSQQELLATIPGATLHGTSSQDNKTKWVQAYSKGGYSGKISGLWGEEPYTSTWYVKDNMWCEKSDMFDACFTAMRVGENSLQMYNDGTEKLRNVWYIR
jgi:hypothetical protein